MTSKIPSPLPSGKDKTITFHRFPAHIWHDQNLSLHERVVLCRVWSFQNSTPPLQCYLSFSQWAEELGCKRRHAITVLNGLIAKNLLLKQSRGTQANIWELVHTEHQQELASACRTLPSVYTAPVLVHTGHQPSVLYAPKKIIEDQIEDHLEDQAVADAPSSSLSPHHFIKTEFTSEQMATLLRLLEVPARNAGKDPRKILDELLVDLERWSHKSTAKKHLRPCWFKTFKQQWVGKKLKELSARPAKPLGPSGLTFQQQQTCFRDFWNEAHGLDRPDLSWVTKEQAAFLQKLMGRLHGSENAYVEMLAKKRSDQFDFQFRDFATAIKELESEIKP